MYRTTINTPQAILFYTLNASFFAVFFTFWQETSQTQVCSDSSLCATITSTLRYMQKFQEFHEDILTKRTHVAFNLVIVLQCYASQPCREQHMCIIVIYWVGVVDWHNNHSLP